jgi:hypothetical protein
MVEEAAGGEGVIQQGHKYAIWACERPVIAVEKLGTDGCWKVMEIEGEWLGRTHAAFPEDLKPLPMKYFGGEVPR